MLFGKIYIVQECTEIDSLGKNLLSEGTLVYYPTNALSLESHPRELRSELSNLGPPTSVPGLVDLHMNYYTSSVSSLKCIHTALINGLVAMVILILFTISGLCPV